MSFTNPIGASTRQTANISQGQFTVIVNPQNFSVVDQLNLSYSADSNALVTCRVPEAQSTVVLTTANTSQVKQQDLSFATGTAAIDTVYLTETQMVLVLEGGGSSSVEQIDLSYASGTSALSEAEVSEAQATAVVLTGGEELVPPIVLPDAETNPMFLANWADSFEITNTWQTTLEASFENGNIEAVSLQERPQRKLQFSWLFGSVNDQLRQKRMQLYEALKNMTGGRTFFPLYSDVVSITDGAGSSVSTTALNWASTCENMAVTEYLMSDNGTLACENIVPDDEYDLTCRRYYQYKPVGLFATNWQHHLIPDTVNYYTIDTVSSNSITFADANFPTLDFGDTVNQTARNWHMVPMVYCELVSEPQIEDVAPGIQVVTIEAYEVFGPTALPALRAPYEVTPTLDLKTNFPNHIEPVSSSYRRTVAAGNQGRGRFVEPLGDRHRVVQEWSLALHRDDWCAAGGMGDIWDGCKGPWRPFLCSEQSDYLMCQGAEQSTSLIYFEPAAIDQINDPPNVSLTPSELSELGYQEWSNRVVEAGMIVIVDFQGNETYKTVVQTQNFITTWAIEVSEGFSTDIPAGQIQRVYPGRLFRFDSNTLIERWLSPCHVQMSVRLEEDNDSADVQIQ